jgi:NitT/TauT family transport system substrate-binding protein
MRLNLTQRIARIACATVLAASATASFAQDKVTFLTSWYAQAEHGGFYQALACSASIKVRRARQSR